MPAIISESQNYDQKMPEFTVQLRVWIAFDTTQEEEEQVADLIRNHEFTISQTWEPGLDDIEYQTVIFADTESNQNTIQELKSALSEEFTDATVTVDSDKGSHHIRDKPYSGVYNIKIER